MTQHEYGEAYETGYPKTVRVLRCRGAAHDLAEDCAQAAWLQGWRMIAQLRDKKALIGWINMIAINYQRRSWMVESRYGALPAQELPGCLGVDSDSMDVAKVLEFCRFQDRPLFEQQLRGLTMAEIAENQGISTTATRLRLFRARRAVRVSLENDARKMQQSYRLQNSAA